MNIEIKRLNDSVPMPTYATDGSAAVDLTYQGYVTGDPEWIIKTGVFIHIKDPHIVGLIFNRSSIPVSLINAVGVIDSDYQGEILLKVYRRVLNIGQRVAQLIFMPIIRPTFIEVKEFSEVTKRGVNGFGSTGK